MDKEGKVFHILNRGVDKKEIFLTEEYYLRFIDNLSGLNNKNNVVSYFFRKKYNNYGHPMSVVRMVDVVCWCLMPNHFHILAVEKVNGGASLFSKKITNGYTKFFNLTNERTGVLFQGKSKIIPLEEDKHFLWVPFYIMANPIKLIKSNYKEKKTSHSNDNKINEFLASYKYSSLLDLIGKTNFPYVVNKKLFYELFDTNEIRFKKDFFEWLFVILRTSDVRNKM